MNPISRLLIASPHRYADLARLWHARGRSAEALSLLSSSYDQFDEGHGTPELQDARTLIETLREAISAKQTQRSERRFEREAPTPAPALKFDGIVVGGAKWARGLSFSGAARRTSH